jgi:hypothetical protein
MTGRQVRNRIPRSPSSFVPVTASGELGCWSALMLPKGELVVLPKEGCYQKESWFAWYRLYFQKREFHPQPPTLQNEGVPPAPTPPCCQRKQYLLHQHHQVQTMRTSSFADGCRRSLLEPGSFFLAKGLLRCANGFDDDDDGAWCLIAARTGQD